MLRLSPTERLSWLREQTALQDAHDAVDKLLSQYEVFLEATNVAEDTLIEMFMDRDSSRKYVGAAYEFGDSMFEALSRIGGGSKFHRLLVV
jgi:hypothetical protein